MPITLCEPSCLLARNLNIKKVKKPFKSFRVSIYDNFPVRFKRAATKYQIVSSSRAGRCAFPSIEDEKPSAEQSESDSGEKSASMHNNTRRRL